MSLNLKHHLLINPELSSLLNAFANEYRMSPTEGVFVIRLLKSFLENLKLLDEIKENLRKKIGLVEDPSNSEKLSQFQKEFTEVLNMDFSIPTLEGKIKIKNKITKIKNGEEVEVKFSLGELAILSEVMEFV